MRFYKMNGLGNEFAVFDARARGALQLAREQAQAIADPNRGVGCDQIIVIEKSIRADAFMRIWNKDGGEVEACGNAARCVAWLIMQETDRTEMTLETLAGPLKADRRGPNRVCVDMGSPLLKWEEIPLAERMDTRRLDLKIGPIDAPVLQAPGAVNMGNPHCVFFVDDLDAVGVDKAGSLVERHPLFPDRVNVGFAEVKGRDAIRLRVWERGVGLTQACGTGACAAVVAATRRGLVDRRAVVTLDGGDLVIEWRESDDRVLMTGPVELEYEAELSVSGGGVEVA
ncbi:MAG: diaminopimelate epimerase [Caulobacterales bacterium]|nr:diaminopimelate epimerase [Caulobacterales bacterium]